MFSNFNINPHKKTNKKQECLHEKCKLCQGTGIKEDGSLCFHYISCDCGKCQTLIFSKGELCQ